MSCQWQNMSLTGFETGVNHELCEEEQFDEKDKKILAVLFYDASGVYIFIRK